MSDKPELRDCCPTERGTYHDRTCRSQAACHERVTGFLSEDPEPTPPPALREEAVELEGVLERLEAQAMTLAARGDVSVSRRDLETLLRWARARQASIPSMNEGLREALKAARRGIMRDRNLQRVVERIDAALASPSPGLPEKK